MKRWYEFRFLCVVRDGNTSTARIQRVVEVSEGKEVRVELELKFRGRFEVTFRKGERQMWVSDDDRRWVRVK